MKTLLIVLTLLSGLAYGEEPVPAKPPPRTSGKRVSIVGPAAAAGAAIGAALAKDNRAKGAIVGAIAGGVAGLIFDQIMKKKNPETDTKDPVKEEGHYRVAHPNKQAQILDDVI